MTPTGNTSRSLRISRVCAGLFLLGLATTARGDLATRQALDLNLPSMVVAGATFHDVHIGSRDNRSVFFTHRAGMASARLRELDADLQARLGFDPATAPAEAPAPVVSKPQRPNNTRAGGAPERLRSAMERMNRLKAAYGTPATLSTRQSLQDDFLRLNLSVKNQGPRPSCSAYAVVSAMEYQYFQLHGQAADMSEDYVVQMIHVGNAITESMTRRTGSSYEGAPIRDMGFTLPEVVRAISIFGIALESEMPPPTPGKWARDIKRPLVDQSRLRRAVYFAPLPGNRGDELVQNLVHALNAGLPVPAGLNWPRYQETLTGILDAQPVRGEGGHAITFVGYESPSCRPEDTVFIFKNSYGEGWGQAGYGRATWAYLRRYLAEAYVLEASALKNPFP